ncbi:hypothetical protein DM02DRAFT_415313 [Periconia macrospinosa]|uniref:N-acetyltransferase domain-containing protein n=1 Tax=Periconia macrospinosa TaxID=97972 RepID=A0A2V1DPV7_9PLEO|nr:hypothetical protein DM02DRAFT_415313 [Periconia macrospinosa]
MALYSGPARSVSNAETPAFSVHVPPRTPIAPEIWDPIVNKQKDLRLTALTLDPSSFSSSYEREIRFEQKDWEARLLNPNVYTLVAIQRDPLDSNNVPIFDAKGFERLARQSWLGNAVLLCSKNEGVALPTTGSHGNSAVCHIDGVYVLPSYRSLGIGNILIQSCKEYASLWARDHEVEHIKIYVRAYKANEKAVQLYRKHGFETSTEKETQDEITMCFEADVSKKGI